MGINVDLVYKTVLLILNKEQRGYLTPYEFNSLATQVQLEIFENFFEDYNQFLRMPKTDEEYASRIEHIREEFQVFEEHKEASGNNNANVYNIPVDPPVHRLGTVFYNGVKGAPAIELVSRREFKRQTMSPLASPSKTFPIGLYEKDKIEVFPAKEIYTGPVDNSDLKFSYIRKPKDVRWGYTVGSLGQYIYDVRSFSETTLAIDSVIPVVNFNSATATAGIYTLTQGTDYTVTPAGGLGSRLVVTITGTGTVTLDSSNTTVQIISPGGTGYNIGDVFKIPALNSIITGLTADLVCSGLASSNFMPSTGQGSVNFEICEAQQTEAVISILKYAGVVIRDPQIIGVANQELQQQEANEKR